MFSCQLSRRPPRRGGGVHIELLEADLADGSQIVVSGNADVVVPLQQVDRGGRIRAIPDKIAQEPNLIEPVHLVGVRDHALERLEIRVHIRDYESAQIFACGKSGTTMIHRWETSPKAAWF